MPGPANVTPPDDGGTPKEDLISKADFDKAVGEKDTALTDVRTQLNEAQLKLVDPAYVEFMEARKASNEKPIIDDKTAKEQGIPESAIKIINDQGSSIKQLQTAVQQIGALLELSDVEKKYADFGNYRDDVQKILETSGSNLTIDQAYVQAKAAAPDKSKGSDETPTPKGSEKPGGFVPKDDSKKHYTDADEAGNAAWAEVKERLGIQGDII